MKLRKLKFVQAALGWWRLKRGLCPSCGNSGLACTVCYQWAAKPANREGVPPTALLRNWSDRHAKELAKK